MLFTLLLGCSFTILAQGNLDKPVALDNKQNLTIGQALQEAGKNQDFFFSYNSDIVPEDSMVNVAGYDGNIRNLLVKMLGDRYEFIETPGYIVIRYAPNRLYLEEGDDEQIGNNWIVKGRIKDLNSNELIAYASVYEQTMLTSSMTDKNGYFELKLKDPNESVLLTVSKEDYRDTTFMLLPPFDIEASRKKAKLHYYPNGDEQNLQSTFFGRMMIGFRQQMQGLNIGNFFAEMPAQVSLVPRLSTHGMMNSQTINHASFNIIGGYTAGTNGVELGGIFNINRKDANYLQVAGVFNLVGGNVSGVQLAGLSNRALGKASGFQAAGLYNHTGPFTGFQLAGLYNEAASSTGLQMAGLMNISEGNTDNQISGLINIGKNVTGFQLTSLLNIADSSAYPIGLINIIKTGEKSFTLGYDELKYSMFTVRTGGTYSYGIVGLAHATEDRTYNWAIDAGLGLHLVNTKWFDLDGELVSRTSFGPPETTLSLASMKLLPAFSPHKNIKLFCGPSLNFLMRQNPEENHIPGWVIEDNSNATAVQAWYMGLSVGLQFVII
ncbi:carboxypeptidase-like regulatory domain-containing protein [Echinicola strongylocentroti]|uniref:carboxypeptidase-like regulatory domain-containing protein n=1 Tax=Echinicola strongylocentroti TaxID=1795355 RepID=UPI001FE312D2|nr:carboxypeptidase-like regulatory domain-containing protein [Echinicola strongylocentroti]